MASSLGEKSAGVQIILFSDCMRTRSLKVDSGAVNTGEDVTRFRSRCVV